MGIAPADGHAQAATWSISEFFFQSQNTDWLGGRHGSFKTENGDIVLLILRVDVGVYDNLNRIIDGSRRTPISEPHREVGVPFYAMPGGEHFVGGDQRTCTAYLRAAVDDLRYERKLSGASGITAYDLYRGSLADLTLPHGNGSGKQSRQQYSFFHRFLPLFSFALFPRHARVPGRCNYLTRTCGVVSSVCPSVGSYPVPFLWGCCIRRATRLTGRSYQ